MNKQGMEMWELVLMILAIILLLFVIGWYASLNDTSVSLLDKLGGLF